MLYGTNVSQVAKVQTFARQDYRRLLLYNIDPDHQITMMPETILVRTEGGKKVAHFLFFPSV